MPPQDIEDIYRLSPLQEGMLFHSLRDSASGVFFEQESYPLGGPVNIPALQRSWQRIIDRHAILRSSYHWEGLENPVQVVHRDVELPLDIQDWRDFPAGEQQRRLTAFLQADRTRGFTFSQPPLIRLALIQLSAHLSQFVFSFHHILLDGWSHHIVMEEVWAMYESYCAGGDGAILAPVRPYADFIEWIHHQDLSKAEAFWRETLKGFDTPNHVGIERPLPSGSSIDAEQGEQSLRLSKRTTAGLQRMAREQRVTMNTVVQGAWAILLSRYCGDADVVFGSVVSGRPAGLPGVECMVGLFINTLPLRARVLPDAFLLPWLRQLQARHSEARDYEYTPMVKIQAWTGMPAGLALFDSIVIFENYPVSHVAEEDEHPKAHSYCFEKTNYPLNLMVVPGSSLCLKLLYSLARFDHTPMTRMLGHLRTILAEIAADPHRRLCELPLLSTQEERQLIIDWNCTNFEYPSGLSISELFEEQVRRTPDATAFLFADRALTYEDLNRRANQMGQYLRTLGLGPESLAGICLERSLDFVVALLAVIKSGAAYVPLDTSYPVERLNYMLKDSAAAVLLTDSRFVSLFPNPGIPAVLLDKNQEVLAAQNESKLHQAADPQSLAYVIYTSGSTGTPKGVAVEYRQILNRLHWMWEAYPFEPGEVCCQKTAASFVDSIWEFLGPLLRGTPTVIVPDNVLRDSRAMVALLAQHRVTRIWTVPSWLRMMLDTLEDLRLRLPALTFWVATGEALAQDLWEQFHKQMPGCKLYNLYGTSEIWDATWFEKSTAAELSERVPIGRPIGNVQAFILDPNLRVQPIGVPGELYIAGGGMARGYRNLPGLTAERFLPNPFGNKDGACLYKTGDLARYVPDGNIEFLGRTDSQVKIRGFRIELEEIEAIVSKYSGIRQAAVIADDRRLTDTQLVAYIVPQQGYEPSIAELRRFLAEKLPEYMAPSSFLLLNSLPMTPSGKLDRRSLKNMDRSAAASGKTYVAPQTPLEKILADMYAGVLHLDQVSVSDNFFTDLGGHSLLATQLVSRIRDNFGFDLPVRTVFDKPTVISLANTLLGDTSQCARIQRTAEIMLTLVEAPDERDRRTRSFQRANIQRGRIGQRWLT